MLRKIGSYKIARDIITITIMTIVVKGAIFSKELIVAWKFGIGDELDAFFVALVIPSFLINVIAGSFNSAFIPTYIKVRQHQGIDSANKLFSSIMLGSLGVLIITTLVTIIAAPLYLPIIGSGFNNDKLSITYRILCLISLIILLNGIQIIWGAMLNAEERFSLVALSPMITPIITIFFLITTRQLDIFMLVISLIFGSLLEILCLGFALKRQKVVILPRWFGFNKNIFQIGREYVPMVAGAFLMCNTNLVDQSMAAMLSPGSVASLNYGNKLISVPLSLISTSVGMVAIPYFSKMVADNSIKRVRHTFKSLIRVIIIITLPITCILLLLSEPIVTICFQRGAFTSQDTYIVSQIQSLYSLQIPFYVGGILLARLASSLQSNHILMYAAFLNLIINITLNYIFLKWFGVAGIALSTSCVYIFSFLFINHFLQKKLQEIH